MSDKLENKVLNITIKKTKVYSLANVVYFQAPHNENLLMNLLIPNISKPTPAIIFVTGGGFTSSDQNRMPQLRVFLAEQGYCVASIQYRVMPRGKFPAPVEDVKSAIRFLKSRAEALNIDPENISLVGDSAGGFLAAFAALTNDSKKFDRGMNLDQTSKIRAAVDLFGIVDLKLFDLNLFPEARGFVTEKNIDEANLLNYVSKDSAPILLMHGTADDIVPPVHSEMLFNALKSVGAEVERYLIKDAGHSDEYWIQDEVLELISNFLQKYTR